MHLKGSNAKFRYKFNRRELLRIGAISTVLSISPVRSFASISRVLPLEKKLSFYNIHTGESLSIVYWSYGEYIIEALNQIDYIMRDHRTGEIRRIDTSLLDLLYLIQNKLHTRHFLHIVSGYRSPSTNNFLFHHTPGVAKNSLHMYGKAVDIRVPDRRLSQVRRVALSLRGGGVGYYPDSDFVHIDVGKVRYWELAGKHFNKD